MEQHIEASFSLSLSFSPSLSLSPFISLKSINNLKNALKNLRSAHIIKLKLKHQVNTTIATAPNNNNSM